MAFNFSAPTPAPAAGGSGFSFGGATTNAAPSTSLFGAKPASSNPAPSTGGLFGAPGKRVLTVFINSIIYDVLYFYIIVFILYVKTHNYFFINILLF